MKDPQEIKKVPLPQSKKPTLDSTFEKSYIKDTDSLEQKMQADDQEED